MLPSDSDEFAFCDFNSRLDRYSLSLSDYLSPAPNAFSMVSIAQSTMTSKWHPRCAWCLSVLRCRVEASITLPQIDENVSMLVTPILVYSPLLFKHDEKITNALNVWKVLYLPSTTHSPLRSTESPLHRLSSFNQYMWALLIEAVSTVSCRNVVRGASKNEIERRPYVLVLNGTVTHAVRKVVFTARGPESPKQYGAQPVLKTYALRFHCNSE